MAAHPDRYSRQVRFPGIGEQGQQRIHEARITIVGCGALGSFQAESLARAGVGYLRLLDRDYVEESNLQRQFLFDEADAAEALPKAIASSRRIAAVNSSIVTDPQVADLTPANIDDLLEDTTLILDGCDNFETRYLINDWAVKHGVPWIYGAAVGSYGLSMPIVPGVTACFACVYPDPPEGPQPTCETAGVLGPLTASIAAWQSAMALRIVCGHEPARFITTMDVWSGTVRQIRQPDPSPDCDVCGKRVFKHLEGPRRAPISLCGRNAVQIHERARPIDLKVLAASLSGAGTVRVTEFALRFVAAPYEMTVFPDGRAIIKGTTDTGVARAMYSRYIGN